MQRRTASPALVLLALGTVVAVARAELPDRAPLACRAQVAAAVSALGPVLAAPGRRARGGPGTLEAAIHAYVPGVLHAVDEGTLPAAHPNARCPSGMASVGGRFCIDRWEGSLVERRADGTEAPWASWAAPLDGHVYLARSLPGVVPQGCVSAAQAAAACSAVGKRLCAPVEWRAACGGSQAWAYPYGPVRQAGKCHDAGAAPMLAFYSAKLRTGWGLHEMNDPRLDQMPDTVAKTGAYPERERLRRLRHGRKPRRVDRRSERHVPGRLLARHVAARRRLRVPHHRARLPLPRLLDRLPLLRRRALNRP